jgi:hypothetical protein
LNPGRRGAKPATNRLSYGAADFLDIIHRPFFFILFKTFRKLDWGWFPVQKMYLDLMGRQADLGSRIRTKELRACYLLNAGFLPGLFFNLKMEVTYFSETLVDFQRATTQRYIPEDDCSLPQM